MASQSSGLCPVKHGEVFHIEEILAAGTSAMDGTSVRVLGRLERLDVRSGVATIVHKGAEIDVDTSNLAGFPLLQGCLFQFIGEIEYLPGDQVILKARIARNVEGLDERLYDAALQMRRELERQAG